MNTQTPPLLLGVDGGGTRTTVWLAHIVPGPGGQTTLSIVGKATGGPSNVRSSGFDEGLGNISKTVAAAFQAADVSPQIADAACLGLAGAGRVSERCQVLQWANQRLATACHVVSDIEALAEAGGTLHDPASSDAPALALIAGTGSMAWGRGEQGQTARAGGWGYLLGDEGSGYWLGSQLLQAACRQQDECNSTSPLMQTVLEHLKLSTVEELVPWCYTAPDSRSRVALLAPLLFAHRTEHPILGEIEDRGAAALARLVGGLHKRLSHNAIDGHGATTPTLTCAGGVLLRQPTYRELLVSKLATEFNDPPLVHWIESPVIGALRLAHALWSRAA